jgi:hypothetical protein
MDWQYWLIGILIIGLIIYSFVPGKSESTTQPPEISNTEGIHFPHSEEKTEDPFEQQDTKG